MERVVRLLLPQRLPLGHRDHRHESKWALALEPEENRRSLHCATPDFLLSLVAPAIFMRLSLTKAAHVAISSAAWQEIRVGSGRDDKFVRARFRVSRKGPRNCRSLGFARDDKGKGCGSVKSRCRTEASFGTLGGPQPYRPEESWACGPSKVMKNTFGRQPLFTEPQPFPLSSRAKPRDLQFRGPFVEMFSTERRDLRFLLG
jgi:hypothetical protein